ncbi:MAG: hypothetical protein ACRBFS_19500 [Aureispira sp.]
MASIEALNKSTEDKKGNGLPFLERKEYLLTNTHNLKRVLEGWPTPASYLPSFQLWVKEPASLSFVSFHYEYPEIDNNTIIPVSIPVTLPPEEVMVNGTKNYIISSNKIPVQAPLPTCGLYTLVLTLLVGGVEKQYYSHEVTVFNG